MSYEEMLKNAMTFKPDLSHWNVSDVACLESMFKDADLNQWDMEKYLESIRNTTVIRFTKEELLLIKDSIDNSIHYYHEFGEVAFSDELKAFRALADKINNLTTEQGE